MIEASPLVSNALEHRLTVNNHEIIIKVGNIPLMPSINKLVKLATGIQREAADIRRELIDFCDEEVKQLDKLDMEILEFQKIEEPTSSDIRKATKLVKLRDLLEKDIQDKPSAEEIVRFVALAQKSIKGILEIICKDSLIDDDVIASLSFGDVTEIANKFYKVNKLDLIPKKMIPQSLKTMVQKLVSGEM